MKVIFASHIEHKTKEIAALLAGLIEVYSMEDIGLFEEIIENGLTLEENALIKAKAVYELSEFPCFADDTGLIVEALNGEPGVYSARYAGEQKSAEDNIAKLLRELKGKMPKTAYFKTVICLILAENTYYFTGILKGTIIDACRGDEGFGYDPIFVPEGYDKTLAEMTLTEKNEISHRAQAFLKMRDFFIDKTNYA